MSARDAVLASIRENLKGVSPAQPAARGEVVPGTPPVLASQAERVAHFRAKLESVEGAVHVARDESAAAEALREIARTHGATEIAVSDAPLARAICERAGLATFDGWSDRERLFACDLGVSSAQWGIAETGTLVLDSTREKHRLVSLVPPVHVAILRADAILFALGDALRAARETGVPPTLLSFITGPSRTADIELTLVVGVHGPEQLHVILIESESE